MSNAISAGESAILANLLDAARQAIDAGDRSEAQACIAQALRTIQPDLEAETATTDAEAPASIADRIQGQRDELFGVYAVIGVLRASINPDHDFDRYQVLGDAYERLDAIAGELDDIATDADHDTIDAARAAHTVQS